MALAKAAKKVTAKDATLKSAPQKGFKVKKKAKAKKLAPDPQVAEQRRQKRVIRNLFQRLGFHRIRSDDVQFQFQGRSGELDDIFVFENIVVLGEYTVGQKLTGHVTKKSILYDKINGNSEAWTAFARLTFPELGAHLETAGYGDDECRVKICYFSLGAVSEEIEAAYPEIYFVDGTKLRYFDALSKTIYRSAVYEFFKFLALEFKEIGQEVKSTHSTTRTFTGHVLPEGFSNFPKGFKVVSFYADPNTLLTMSYVLRRDSWRDSEGMYQRVLQRGRMTQMRRYLTTEERVFVNNIIVTLPNDTMLNSYEDGQKNVDPTTIKTVAGVSVSVPFRSNTIGIVDGQHRVFCYHEGADKFEPKISALRKRQNLLVTGIVYPHGYSEDRKRRFEAKLFLEINDKQKRTNSELKQSIELILNPYSTIAIAKAVVQKLNATGVLKGLLQTNYFDPPSMIRTTSIVSYGLRPLLKLDGSDSLFNAWQRAGKERLRELQRSHTQDDSNDPVLAEYISFCVKSINDLLIAAKKNDLPSRWVVTAKPADRLLTPTVINGYIVCLRLLVENGKLASLSIYEKKFAGLSNFSMTKYKSSHWRALGEAIYQEYFA